MLVLEPARERALDSEPVLDLGLERGQDSAQGLVPEPAQETGPAQETEPAQDLGPD